jgi:beta-mannosidase
MNFTSKEFLNHQKHPTGFKTLNHYLKNYFYETNNLPDYSYLTQCLQAYTLTTAIEAQRRSYPYCNGTLVWQLNDCWPACSWSVTDYNGKKKIAAHEIEKAFDTLLLSMKEERNRFDIYLVNDSDFPLEDSLEFYISDFSGKYLYDKKISIKCEARSSSVVFQLNDKEIESITKNKVFALASLKKNKYRKNFHFVRPNELQLLPSEFDFFGVEDTHGSGTSEFSVILQSNTYCPFVKIENKNSPYEQTQYLPFLLPGQKKKLPEGFFKYEQFIQGANYGEAMIVRCLNEFSTKK